MTCYRDADGDWREDQHAHECDDLACRGCIPCQVDDHGTPVTHCPACHRRAAHLTPGEHVCPRCIGAIREALAQIETAYALLPEEAQERGVDSEAAVLVGPAADVEAWGYRHASAIVGRKDHISLIEPNDPHHPLIVLGWWTMAWCEDFGHDRPERFTVSGSVSYLTRNLSDYALDPHQDFPSFAAEIRSCRAHLELVLRNSRAPERGAPCPACAELGIDKPPRLVLHRNQGDTTGARDQWRCPDFGMAHEWSEAAYRYRIGSDHIAYATELTADNMTQRTGVPASTIRRWASVTRKDGEDVPPLLKSCGKSDDKRKLYRVADVEALQEATSQWQTPRGA